jgi:hypothetical protein
MKPTKEQLQKFVEIRNASPHIGNLQFYIDAKEAGLEPTLFETPQNLKCGYLWRFTNGTIVERSGRLMGERFKLFKAGTIIDSETGEPVTKETIAARFM